MIAFDVKFLTAKLWLEMPNKSVHPTTAVSQQIPVSKKNHELWVYPDKYSRYRKVLGRSDTRSGNKDYDHSKIIGFDVLLPLVDSMQSQLQ